MAGLRSFSTHQAQDTEILAMVHLREFKASAAATVDNAVEGAAPFALPQRKVDAASEREPVRTRRLSTTTVAASLRCDCTTFCCIGCHACCSPISKILRVLCPCPPGPDRPRPPARSGFRSVRLS